jgi:hypothetical protein
LLDGKGTFTNRNGATRPLLATDILVVAPYNMQVRCLHEALPPAVAVGTVDTFQGREGAVVFFSMTSSTGDADWSSCSIRIGLTLRSHARSASRWLSVARAYWRRSAAR